DASLLRPVLELQLLEQGAACVGLDVARQMPRHAHQLLSARERNADRARQRRRAFEAWRAVVDPQRPVGFDRQWTIRRLDREPQLVSAVLTTATDCEAVAVKLARSDEGPLALCWTDQ